jgi:hypothetical protein
MGEKQRREQLLTSKPSIYHKETKETQPIDHTRPSSESDPEGRKNELEKPEWQDRLRKLIQWRRQARVYQADNRMEMAIDEDYYDSIQYEPEDLHIFEERNQAPLIYNIVKSTINWILGTELKLRVDYRILPRTKAGAIEAKTKTKVFKYVEDTSQAIYARTRAFEECIKAGLGWLEVGVRSNNEEAPLFIRSERWRNMWFDHLGLEPNGADWRYEFREKWIDLDIAQAMFPERKDDLKVLAEGVNSLYPYLPDDVVVTDNASEFDLESDLDSLFGGPFDGARERVKLIECWYRMPAQVQLLKMRDEQTPYGALDGTIYRKGQPDHDYLVKGNYFSTFDAMVLTVRCAIWGGATYLQDILTPYNHNRFPFIPLFCYRRKRDNMPYGVIRDLRDPQSSFNKQKSRTIFILASNQMMYEKGAFDNPEKAHDEMQRPDGMIEYNKGAKVEPVKQLPLAEAHIKMAQADQEFIENTAAGITRENLGKTEKDLSGKAIGKLQEQGAVVQGVFFDNYYFAFQCMGEILGVDIEQFFDKEQEILVTGDQSKDEFVKINEMTEEGELRNSITREKARFIVAKQDYRESIRMAMAQAFGDLVQNLSKTMPEVALALLDIAVEYMGDVLPNSDEAIARIRKINKQHAPEDEMTPEEKDQLAKAKEQDQAQQQALEQIQQAMAQAKVAIEQSKATKQEAETMKAHVEAQMKKLEGFLKAMEVAGVISASPQIVAAADKLVKESQVAPGNGGNGKNGRQLSPRQEGMG